MTSGHDNVTVSQGWQDSADETPDEKIRESEARMRFALEAGALGMWEWDLESDSWVYNVRWAEMRGYAPGDIVPWYTDWHPDDEARLQPIADALMSGAIDSYEIEYRTPHRDGSWRWLNARTKVMKRAPDGRPLRIVGVQTDINERRLAEEAARANQQWLQLTIDATELGVWDWNGTNDTIVWSPRCAHMLGYAHGELPGNAKDWATLRHPDDEREAHAQFVRHMQGHTAQFRAEIRCRAKGGSWVWILSHGRVIERGADGRALRAVGTHQDISQIKQAAIALRESEARLRTVVENSPVGIFLTDPAGHLLYCNPVIGALSGSDPVLGVADEWQQYVHPDDRPALERRWQAFIAAPDGVYDAEWRAVIPERDELRIRVRAAAIREAGRVLGFAGTLEDVTEQRAAEVRERALENQLQQARKVEAIGALTGGIAHDFNNSLATILGFATLALGRPSQDDKLTSYLESVVQAAEHSRDLVRKLLDFSRSTPAGEVAAIDARVCVSDAVRMLSAAIPSTIQITTQLDAAVPPVQIDATEMHQVLFNLALNARDAIAGHGEIRIALHAPRRVHGRCAACHHAFDGDYVELSLADSGSGIPPASLSRIFDPFYSTKPVGQGTGMGLSVIHGIVHRVGGHVLVESSPAQGTCVRVLLQVGSLASLPVKPAPPPLPEASGLALPRARVLVVDDEPSLVRFLCEWLGAEGYGCVAFSDPLAAQAWAESPQAAFDVLLTDQTMPGLTGLELARSLHTARPGLPVILCTGLADRVDALQARALGVTALFLKPLPLPELLAALARVAPSET